MLRRAWTALSRHARLRACNAAQTRLCATFSDDVQSQMARDRRAALAAQKQQRRFWLVMGSLGAAAAAVFFVLWKNEDLVMYYLTPTQMLDPANAARLGRHARLGGLVLENSVHYRQTLGFIEFVVTDLVTDIPVRYTGILPNLFKEGKTVIAQGRLNPDDGIFYADVVLAKHDENYMPKEVAEAMEAHRKQASEKENEHAL
jgi:cytochrome c-type biogenesis protein CcmE